jgi:hypothetical protein
MSVEAANVVHGAARGAVAAMAMTGMRTFTVEAGIVEEPPPEAMFKQAARKLLRKVPRSRRREVIELAHWGYGAAGGAVFAALPEDVRRRAWAGALYGVAVWVGFEALLAPALRLQQAREVRAAERAALAIDHVLYGVVLSEFRRRPVR